MSLKLNTANLTALVIGMSMSASPAKADTSLPYIGPVMGECKINHPEGPEWADKDAGYMTDESCKIIYVKPPILGKLKIGEPMLLNQTQDCADLNEIRSNIRGNYKRRVAKLTGEALLRETSLYQRNIAELEKIGADSTAAFVSAGALISWEDLTNEYIKLNRDKIVRRMPLATGLLSAKRVTPPLKDDIYASGGKVIRSLEVHGIELPSDMSEIKDFPLPDYMLSISGAETKPILMGQAMALSLELNLNGACALLDKDLNLVKSPEGYLSASYTYFYPVQTKSGFTISFEIERIKAALLELLSVKPTSITATELREVVSKKAGFTIDLHSGAFPTDSPRAQELLKEYKAEIEEHLSEIVLLNLSDAVDVAINEAKYTDTESRAQRVCSRRWYRLGGKKCITHHYTVSVEKIDWRKVKNALVQYQEKAKGGVSEYMSYYMMDSLAFVPQYKTQPKVTQLYKK